MKTKKFTRTIFFLLIIFLVAFIPADTLIADSFIQVLNGIYTIKPVSSGWCLEADNTNSIAKVASTKVDLWNYAGVKNK